MFTIRKSSSATGDGRHSSPLSRLDRSASLPDRFAEHTSGSTARAASVAPHAAVSSQVMPTSRFAQKVTMLRPRMGYSLHAEACSC